MNDETRMTNDEGTAASAGSVRHSSFALRHYLSLYAALWRNSVIRELGFKVNFLMWIVVEGLWFALQLTFIGVLYLLTESIGSWTKWQVVALVGTSHLIQQLFTAIFLTNLTALSEHIRTGKLDFMLLLSVNTRFLISFRKSIRQLRQRVAAGVMAYAAASHLAPTLPQQPAFSCSSSSACSSTLTDVCAGEHGGPCAPRHRLGLLQPVQHRPPAGRASAPLQSLFHVRDPNAAGEQRPVRVWRTS